MKRFLLISIIAFACSWANAQQLPNKQEFLNFWSQFKDALKTKNADFVYGHMLFPFSCDGGYYNPEATIEEVKENNQMIIPAYRKEMEFVRFDPVLIEAENAYIWLGYSTIEKAYFYSYKKLSATTNTPSYEENYWFVKKKDGFKFYKVTVTVQ